MEKHLSKLSLEAGQIILSEGRADPTRVKIIKQTGQNMLDTSLITGLALAKSRIHPEMKERGGPGSILILDGGLERKKPQFEAKLNTKSAGMLDAFRKSETKAVLAQVETW